MKVILLQDVAKIGRRSDVVEVPNGFALNKLFPQGLAQEATPANIKRVAATTEQVAAKKADVEQRVSDALEKLAAVTVKVTAPANDQGHLFEALKPAAIVEAIQTHGVSVDESEIVFAEPIKEVGEHVITITEGAVTGSITVSVTAA